MLLKSTQAAVPAKKSDNSSKSRRFSFRKPGKVFNKLLKLTLGNYLKHKYGVNVENGIPKDLNPPYIIFSNHTNTWDPFILSHFVEEPVCFVTSDFHFRKPLLRMLLGLVGAIPKSKGVSDIESIKSIIQARKSGCIIGIFPEGQRCWDGHSLDIIPATSKLIKLLKVPVVTCLMKGAYLSLPRWGKKIRKGQIKLDFKLSLTSEEASSLNVDDIHHQLVKDLCWDEYAYQESQLSTYIGKEAARYLELYLFMCPVCGSIGMLVSKSSSLICRKCGTSVKYNAYGYFESEKDTPLFKTPSEWNKWQLEELSLNIGSSAGGPIFSDSKVVIKRGSKYSPLKKYGYGTITMFKDRIEFTGISVRDTFRVQKIHGANVQFNDVFEFYYDDILYTFLFRNKTVSAYKWVEAVKASIKFIKA